MTFTRKFKMTPNALLLFPLIILVMMAACSDGQVGTTNSLGLSNTVFDAEPPSVMDEKCIGGVTSLQGTDVPYVNLAWTLPQSPGVDKLLVLRRSASALGLPGNQGSNPVDPWDPDAEVLYFGAPVNFIQDSNVVLNEFYHYGIWTFNEAAQAYSPLPSFCQAQACENEDALSLLVQGITAGSAQGGDSVACLAYEIPSSVGGVRIYRKANTPFTGAPKDDPEASVVYEGAASQFQDTPLDNATPYFYAVYALDDQGILSSYAYLLSATPSAVIPTPEEVSQLVASDLETGAAYGHALDIQGTLMAVGAHLHDTNGLAGSGRVYVYRRDINHPQASWSEQQVIPPPFPSINGAFGEEVVLSSEQDLLIVGAPTESSGAIQTGAVYVYTLNGSEFQLQSILLASAPAALDRMGTELDFTKDPETYQRIIGVGVVGRDGPNVNDAGALYIFEEAPGGTWNQIATIAPANVPAGHRFGSEVKAFNGRFAVSGENRVYMVEKINGTWQITQEVTPQDLQAGDDFGYEVVLDDNTLIVSAPRADILLNGTLTVDAGAAYVFSQDATGAWTQEAKVTASDAADFDRFGEDLDFDPIRNLLVISSEEKEVNGVNTGVVYSYKRYNEQWHALGQVATSEPQAGGRDFSELRLSGGTLITGAPRKDVVGLIDTGKVYIFDVRNLGSMCPAPDTVIPSILGTPSSQTLQSTGPGASSGNAPSGLGWNLYH